MKRHTLLIPSLPVTWQGQLEDGAAHTFRDCIESAEIDVVHAPTIMACLRHRSLEAVLTRSIAGQSGQFHGLCLAVAFLAEGINDFRYWHAPAAREFGRYADVALDTRGYLENFLAQDDIPVPDAEALRLRLQWAKHIADHLEAALDNYLAEES